MNGLCAIRQMVSLVDGFFNFDSEAELYNLNLGHHIKGMVIDGVVVGRF